MNRTHREGSKCSGMVEFILLKRRLVLAAGLRIRGEDEEPSGST